MGEGSTRWVVHGERTVYDNPWVRLALVDVELPDGERFEHHVVRLRAAAMAVLVNGHGEVLMMWRHRFVPDRWGWELPGGLVDAGEDPAGTVAREVEEETGWRVKSLTHLVTFQPMVGMVDSPHHVYRAGEIEYVGEPIEVTESERVEWVPLGRVRELIADGQVLSSGTLVALLHVLAGVSASRD